MNFESNKLLSLYLKKLIPIGMGSCGECFLNPKTNQVFKIFNQFFEEEEGFSYEEEYAEYDEKEILRFANIKAPSFIFANNIITVNGHIVGYISKYANAKRLNQINPLIISLEKLKRAILEVYNSLQIVSNEGIKTYDMMYNILYHNKFYIIDQDEYSYNDMDNKKLYNYNRANFDQEIYYFLIEAYLDEFINQDARLKEMFGNREVDVLTFISELQSKLSERVQKPVSKLSDAKPVLNKQKVKKPFYARDLF